MSYKKSNWVPYDPTLSFEQNVTQGGTTTADKLNNMETGISNAFDKTSDTIGGRNLLIGSTDNIVHYSSVTGYTVWKSYVTQFNIGDTLNVSADITSNAGNTVLKVYLASSTGIQLGYLSHSVSEGQTAHAFVSKVIPTGTTSILVQIDNSNSNGIGQADVCAINHQFANTGSVVANWTPAPEDKVNVSDMRKPASDVAGIEEVNAKQDAIAYTPADDSKVVHDNKDGTEQLNGVQVQPFNKLSDTIGGRNLLINTAQLNDSTVCLDAKSNISDTYLGLNIYQTKYIFSGIRIYWSYLVPKLKTDTNYVISEYVRNTSPTTSCGITLFENDAIIGKASGIVYNKYGFSTILPPNSGWTRISALINIASFPTNIVGKLRFESTNALTDGYVQFAGLKLEQGSIATDWTPAPEDKADDTKVAHLSGANDFDTVPTVNNNPVATTDDVATASNTVLTSANTSISKLLQSSSNNDEDSAVTNSTSDTSNFYYWTE